jgi:hypothetical protein
VYRNARTQHMHNVPTWDHRNPADVSGSCPLALFFFCLQGCCSQ